MVDSTTDPLPYSATSSGFSGRFISRYSYKCSRKYSIVTDTAIDIIADPLADIVIGLKKNKKIWLRKRIDDNKKENKNQ
jgi:hypothetical protein